MKLISTLALLMFTATAAMAQTTSATVTGAIDTNKNRTTATEAKEDTKAGNKQAIAPANAGNEAAQQTSATANKPKEPDGSKPR